MEENKMTISVEEVHSLLNKENALIIHFSVNPKGSGTLEPHDFPEDLQYAIACPHKQRSCSIVRPGDTWVGQQCYGEVGLILDIRGSGSIVQVSRGDGGTPSDMKPETVTIDDCRFSLLDDAEANEEKWSKLRAAEIIKRGGDTTTEPWNEWRLVDYNVMGIYVENESSIAIWGDCTQDGHSYKGETTTSLDEIKIAFPALSIYSFNSIKNIVQVHPTSQIYKF